MNTPANEAVEIWDTEYVLVSAQNTRQPTPKEVAELMKSISEQGQLTPGLARPHPTQAGFLELAAGARRRTACHELKIHFKVIVREMTDAELLDAILTENLQREDPDPEAEATLIGIRIEEGATPSEIAARYGKTEIWVKRRMKLLALIPEMRATLAKSWAHYTTEMRERLGELSADIQKQILNGRERWHFDQALTFADLKQALGKLSNSLKGLKWLTDPDTFVKGCGPGCATDSSAGLFPETGKGACGSCLNAKCFAARSALAADKALRTEIGDRKLTDFILFSTEYVRGEPHFEGKKLTLVDHWKFGEHYKISEQPTELLGIDFTKGTPKVCFLERRIKRSSSGGSPGVKESREDRLTGKRLAEMNAELVEATTKAPVPSSVALLQLVAAFGLERKRAFCQGEGDHKEVWAIVDAEPGAKISGFETAISERLSVEQAIWQQILPILRSRIIFHTNSSLLNKAKRSEMERIASLIGFDYEAFWTKICTELVPVPKSWGPGIDPVSLKKLPGKHTLHERRPAKKAVAEEPTKEDAVKVAKKEATKKTARPAKQAAKKAATKSTKAKAKPAAS